MANEDGKVVIEIDLDSAEYNKTLRDTQKDTEAAAKSIGADLDTYINGSLAKITKTAEESGGAISTLVKNVQTFVSIAAKVAPFLILIEAHTKIFSKTAEKLGFNVDEIKNKFEEMIKTLVKVVIGEKSINDLKLAMGMLLTEFGLVDSKIISILSTLSKLDLSVGKIASGTATFAATGALLVPLIKNLDSIKSTGADLAKLFFGGKGLFGFTSALTSTSIALYALSSAFEDSDNAVLKLSSSLTKFAAILIGGVAAAISYIILQVSDIAHEIGNKLVDFFKKAGDSFSYIERSLVLFEASVNATNRTLDGSIGTFKVWEAVVGQVADKFNLVREDVRKAGQEIVLIGPKLGLVESQMRKLLVVSAEYAKINHKDVYETTIAMVNALTGNSQAVAALGIRLNAASLQQYAYAEGITKTVQSLTDAEKTQLRFNSILEQYHHVAGLGALAAQTLAEQNDRLKINQDRLNAAMGAGARIIEQNNLAAFVYNKVLDNVSDSVTKAVGFFGAFSARILQVGGALLGVAFKVYAVTKAFKLLEIIMASEVGIKAFAANIPLINRSLNTMLSMASGMEIKITSLQSLFVALGGTVKSQLGIMSVAVGGGTSKMKMAFASLTAVLVQTRIAFTSLYGFLLPFLAPFAKIIAIVAAVGSVLYGLYKSITVLEEHTKVFSASWQVLVDILNDSGSIFAPMINMLTNLGSVMKTLVTKVFGVFISSIAGIMRVMSGLVASNPFGIFSDKTVASVKKIEGSLNGFLKRMLVVDFDVRQFTNNVSRSMAGMAEKAKFSMETLAKFMDDIRDRFKGYGKTEIQRLQSQYLLESEMLDASLASNLTKLTEYNEKKLQLTAAYTAELGKLQNKQAMDANATIANTMKAMKIYAKSMKTTAGEIAKTMVNLAVAGFGNSFKAMGAAMAAGDNALQAFADSIKAVFGDLASAIGDFYIKRGIAAAAARDPGAYAMIAGGAALKVLAGALGSTATTGGTAGAGGGATTGDAGVQTQETALLTDTAAEKEEADTGITVNIQGDILDGQETGNRIVDVLNDAFGKNGAILTNVRMA